ncbi:glycosyltransferase [candidate division WOR-3 bacterium]|nr:glycosyltransferase [candidate division WOR-3 bacterium]
MRICVVSYHASPLEPVGAGKSGGMSIVLKNLYRRMAGFAEVDIFVRGKGQPVSLEQGINVVYIDQHDTTSFAEEVMSQHALRQYDLLHTHYWSSGVVGRLVNKVSRIPWLHTLHTVEVLKTIKQDRVRIDVEEEIVRSCDLVVSPTRQEANALNGLYPDVKPISVPHGVDTDMFRPSLDGHSNILYVGRIDPIKGLDVLVDALRMLERDVKLIVIGGPSKGERNFDSIKTYGSDLQIEFMGPVKHEDLARYYSKTSMVVVPSYYESFGLVGLEAMASARPVVGFSHTGLSETVSEDAGILVKMSARNLAGAIDTLAGNHELRQELGKSGRNKVLAYDWSNIARVYQTIYEKVIEK